MEHTTLIEHRFTRTDWVQVNVISFAHLVSKQRQINPQRTFQVVRFLSHYFDA